MEDKSKMISKRVLIIAGIFILAAATIVAFNTFSNKGLTGKIIDINNLSIVTLKVAIPCPGHAFLIEYYLNNLDGVENTEYKPITTFVVYYDKNKTSEADILSLGIFKDYPATKIN